MYIYVCVYICIGQLFLPSSYSNLSDLGLAGIFTTTTTNTTTNNHIHTSHNTPNTTSNSSSSTSGSDSNSININNISIPDQFIYILIYYLSLPNSKPLYKLSMPNNTGFTSYTIYNISLLLLSTSSLYTLNISKVDFRPCSKPENGRPKPENFRLSDLDFLLTIIYMNNTLQYIDLGDEGITDNDKIKCNYNMLSTEYNNDNAYTYIHPIYRYITQTLIKTMYLSQYIIQYIESDLLHISSSSSNPTLIWHSYYNNTNNNNNNNNCTTISTNTTNTTSTPTTSTTIPNTNTNTNLDEPKNINKYQYIQKYVLNNEYIYINELEHIITTLNTEVNNKNKTNIHTVSAGSDEGKGHNYDLNLDQMFSDLMSNTTAISTNNNNTTNRTSTNNNNSSNQPCSVVDDVQLTECISRINALVLLSQNRCEYRSEQLISLLSLLCTEDSTTNAPDETVSSTSHMHGNEPTDSTSPDHTPTSAVEVAAEVVKHVLNNIINNIITTMPTTHSTTDTLTSTISLSPFPHCYSSTD